MNTQDYSNKIIQNYNKMFNNSIALFIQSNNISLTDLVAKGQLYKYKKDEFIVYEEFLYDNKKIFIASIKMIGTNYIIDIQLINNCLIEES